MGRTRRGVVDELDEILGRFLAGHFGHRGARRRGERAGRERGVERRYGGGGSWSWAVDHQDRGACPEHRGGEGFGGTVRGRTWERSGLVTSGGMQAVNRGGVVLGWRLACWLTGPHTSFGTTPLLPHGHHLPRQRCSSGDESPAGGSQLLRAQTSGRKEKMTRNDMKSYVGMGCLRKGRASFKLFPLKSHGHALFFEGPGQVQPLIVLETGWFRLEVC